MVVNANTSFINPAGEVYSTDLLFFVLPQWYRWANRGIYVGVVPAWLFLVVLGRQRRQAALWLFLLAVAFLLAVGPAPSFGGIELGITFPWSWAIATLLRHPYRFNILIAFALAMIAAYGWLAVSTGIKQRRRQLLLLLVLSAGIFAEYTVLAFPYTRLIASPFYTEYLEEIPDEVALAILPRNRQFDKEYMYQQTLHGHKMVNGTISRHTQGIIEYIAQNPLLLAGSTDLGSTTLPRTSHSLAMMADAGIGYLVLDKTHIEETSEWELADWRRLMQGEPAYEDELLLVYAISPDSASDHE